MSDTPDDQQTPQPQRANQPGKRPYRDLIEEILAEAQARGDFDNLAGKGKPLRLEDDTFAGEKALGYRLLKNNQMAPPEIERGREIDAQLAQAEELLATLRRRRNALLGRGASVTASDRRAYTLVRDNTEARYRELLRVARSNILSLNIIAPPLLHRPLVRVEDRMRAFTDEFPRMPEE